MLRPTINILIDFKPKKWQWIWTSKKRSSFHAPCHNGSSLSEYQLRKKRSPIESVKTSFGQKIYGSYMIDLQRVICKLVLKLDFTACSITESLSEFGLCTDSDHKVIISFFSMIHFKKQCHASSRKFYAIELQISDLKARIWAPLLSDALDSRLKNLFAHVN